MRITYVGLGNMGAPMARHILAAGHDLTLNDLRQDGVQSLIESGARFVGDLGAAVASAEVVLLSLPGPPEVQRVCLGGGSLLSSMARGSLLVDLTTNSPTVVREIHASFAEKGIGVVDAPVSGGVMGAQAGNLQLMVGGDESDVARVRDVLKTFSEDIAYLGPIGSGCVAKLVHNLIAASAAIAVYEGFSLGMKAGLKAEALLSVLRGGALGRHFHRFGALERNLQGKFDIGDFRFDLAQKDVALAMDLARAIRVPMDLSALTEQMMLEGLQRGWAARDAVAVPFLIQEQRAGVTMRFGNEDSPGS